MSTSISIVNPGDSLELLASPHPLIWIRWQDNDIWLHYKEDKEVMLALHQLRWKVDREINRRCNPDKANRQKGGGPT